MTIEFLRPLEPTKKLPEGVEFISPLKAAKPLPGGVEFIGKFESAGVPAPEKHGPPVKIAPMEHFKIYKKLNSLPSQVSTAVKQKAIDEQRAKKFGTISMPEPNLFESMVKGAKNIPENIKDIIVEAGSLIMNIGRFGFNFSKNFPEDLNDMFAKKEFYDPEKKTWFPRTAKQFEPTTDLASAVVLDWKEIFSGKTPTEVEKTPIGQALQGEFKRVEDLGVKRYIYKFIEERPVDALILGRAAQSAIGQGVRLTATTAGKLAKKGSKFADMMDEFVSTKRSPLVYELPSEVKGVRKVEKSIEFPMEYSKDPLVKYTYDKSFDTLLDTFPKLKDALITNKANKLLNNMRKVYEEGNFKERVKIHKEISDQLKTLSEGELKVMVPYLEGRASLVGEVSEPFKAFEGWYKDFSKTVFDDLSQAGKITPETARDRLYQPLAKATGKSVDEVMAEFGNTLSYVHHTFPKTFAERMGIHFADTTGKRYIPSFLKKSKGVQGYSEDLSIILPKFASEYVKFKNTEGFIKDLTTKFGIETNIKNVVNVEGGLLIKGKKIKGVKQPDRTLKGYKILAPDGYLNFYQGKVDFYNKVFDKLDNLDVDESIAAVLAETLKPKTYTGVSKNKKVWLIPAEQAKQLESFATPLFGSQKIQNRVKVFYDKPVQVWKDSVLAASPRWLKNNVMGDIIFNTFEGVGPLSYGRSFSKKYQALIPDEVGRASFAEVMKYNPKLGLAARTTVGKLIAELEATKAVQGIAKIKDAGYALNTMMEQPFVRALYINKARGKAVEILKTRKVPRTEANILGVLQEIKDTPALNAPLIKTVKETLPVFDLTGNFERKYLKRIVPFYNWFKFMTKYGASLPQKHPFKLVGARGLGALSENQREDAFIQMFPFIAAEVKKSGIPDRYDNLWPVKIKEDGKALFFNARGLNPFATIDDLVSFNIGSMVSPIVQIGMERATGRELYSGREYTSGEEGVAFKEHRKIRPSFFEHVMSKTPLYGLLKQTLTPALQYDTGTIFNPEPIVDKITGEAKYPIESLEKWLNFVGVDRKTVDIKKSWEQYQNKKRAAVSKTFEKFQSTPDMALTPEEVGDLFKDIKKDKPKWNEIKQEIKRARKSQAQDKKDLRDKIKGNTTINKER